MEYNLDVVAFKKWYMRVARFPGLLPFNLTAAEVVMGSQFIKKVEPKYRLPSSNTKSGEEEIFPEPMDFGNVVHVDFKNVL